MIKVMRIEMILKIHVQACIVFYGHGLYRIVWTLVGTPSVFTKASS